MDQNLKKNQKKNQVSYNLTGELSNNKITIN